MKALSPCGWARANEGNPNCAHDMWSISPFQILTFPAKLHLTCVKCGKRQCCEDESTATTVDMVFLGPVTVQS